MGATQDVLAGSVRRALPRKATAGITPPPILPLSPPLGWNASPYLPVSYPPAAGAEIPTLEVPPQRCCEKGCVFPAAQGAMGRCAHHDRQQQEPALYQSYQPTLLVVERAKFGIQASEFDDTRGVDRRRLALERQAFLED